MSFADPQRIFQLQITPTEQKPIRICVEFVLEIFAEQSFSFLNPVQPHGRDVGTTAMITEEKPTKLSDCRVFGDEAINLLYD